MNHRGQRSAQHALLVLAALLLVPGWPAFAEKSDGKASDKPSAKPAKKQASEKQSAQGQPNKSKGSTAEQPLTERQKAIHALNRLAFGPRPGQVEKVVEMGWKKWAKRQLQSEKIDDSELTGELMNLETLGSAVVAARTGVLDGRLKEYPSLLASPTETYRFYKPSFKTERTAENRQQRGRMRNRMRGQLQRELVESVLVRAVHSKRQFREVIVDFWRNHFNVFHDKSHVRYHATNYEQDVIRAHAFGKFEDMLMASAKHPAMLYYLDNRVSKKNGINENYAREIMELHTLGADNYYTQEDVRDLSYVLTGWTCGWKKDENGNRVYGFIFRENWHDTKPRKVLGMKFDGTEGVKAGEKFIRYLAHHKGTSEYIALKLCRYLVSDNPPQALVDKVAKVFRETGGDLPKVYRAIIFSEAFTGPAHYGAKFKTPFEFVVSALRASEAEVKNPRWSLQRLRSMGMRVYGQEFPTGYDDRAEAWMDPGALVDRWNYALDLAHSNRPGALYKRWKKLKPAQVRQRVTQRILTYPPAPETAKAIKAAKKPKKILSLTLGSPAFQRQ